MARVHRRRRAALRQLPRDGRAHRADVRPARRRRHAVHCSARVVAVYNLYRTARQGALHRATSRRRRRRCRPARRTAAAGWHRALEARPVQFAVLTLVAVVIGGVVEFVPTALVRANVPTIAAVKPYTPLELEGRDLYIREGCVGCHSQMVRPIRAETERYGEYSKAGEFVYDHPFLWGSKRTGPDLHRVGGKYPDSWHFLHMKRAGGDVARIDHARLPVALRRTRSTPRTSKARSSRCAGSACRIRTATSARPRGDLPIAGATDIARRACARLRGLETPRRPRDRRAHRLPAAARHGHQGQDADAARASRGDRRRSGGQLMYTDILRAIAGIEIFPVDLAGAVRRRLHRGAGLAAAARPPAARSAARASRSLDEPAATSAVAGAVDCQGVRRDPTSATNCSTTRPTASASSTTPCRAGGCTASTSRSSFAVAYLVNYHVLPTPFVGAASLAAEYQRRDGGGARASARTAAARRPRRLSPCCTDAGEPGARARRSSTSPTNALLVVPSPRPRRPGRPEPHRRPLAARLHAGRR